MNTEALFQKLNTIEPITRDDFARFLNLAPPREVHLNPGEYFVRPGESALETGFIISGVVKAFFLTLEGDVFIKRFPAEGEFTGSYSAMIQKKPSSVFVQAIEKTHLLAFDSHKSRSLFTEDNKWQAIGRKIAEWYYCIDEDMIIARMTMSAEERYKRFLKINPHLRGRIPQQDIAAHLGITAVALSRVRKKLKDEFLSQSTHLI